MPFLKEVKEIALPVRQPKAISHQQGPEHFLFPWRLASAGVAPIPLKVNLSLSSQT
jgi:hypothetical protein